MSKSKNVFKSIIDFQSWDEMLEDAGDEKYKLETPANWWPRLKQMTLDFRALEGGEYIRIDQIKEKYGELRVYISMDINTPPDIAKVKAKYEMDKQADIDKFIEKLYDEVFRLIEEAEKDIAALEEQDG